MASKRVVQAQFGDKAEAYASSAVHARGDSLARLAALVTFRPDWRVLDVATGAGHTAHQAAPHVRQVIATDLTVAMVAKTLSLAGEKLIDNVEPAVADAEFLPLVTGSVDLVTCRIAAHHFPDVERFVSEAARVLRPGGLLAVVDNVVPGSGRRGKKARLQREAGRYVNAFERLRDPSHVRCLTVYEWRELLATAGFTVRHEEVGRKVINFAAWVERMRVPQANVTRLRAMLVQAPKEALEFLTPEFRGDRIDFSLSEALFLALR